MKKFYMDLKAGLEEALAYKKGAITLHSELIEIRNTRKFAVIYHDVNVATAVATLPWSHNITMLEKLPSIKDIEAELEKTEIIDTKQIKKIKK